jgi:LPXTG-site transpeptidase (sortase) family protein
MYVAGHSSDYIWKHDPMAHIFTTINHLSAGDDVFITVYGTDDKIYTYRYRVTTQKTYSPDDQTQFIDDSVAKLNLSTCWPIGSTKDRLVVSAELVSL